LGDKITPGEIHVDITPDYAVGLDAYATAVRNSKVIVLEAVITADRYERNPNYGKIGYEAAPEYELVGTEEVMTAKGSNAIKIQYINIPKIQ
jgi:hypothetical protein